MVLRLTLQVGMKFNRDFVKTLDSTGGLLLALSNVSRER